MRLLALELMPPRSLSGSSRRLFDAMGWEQLDGVLQDRDQHHLIAAYAQQGTAMSASSFVIEFNFTTESANR